PNRSCASWNVRTSARASNTKKPLPPITLKPGTRLVREWRGVSYSVLVHADGFEWNGRRISFAQFEREIAGERIRDKIAASKAKGMWMGGNVPLGYDVKDRKLVVNEAEALTVRLIFRRYAELGSVALLKAELDRTGIVSKRREGASGSGGKRVSCGGLYLKPPNRLFRGGGAHQEEINPGA